MKSSNRAEIRPYPDSPGKPIAITWNEKSIASMTKFFAKTVRNCLKEDPPRRYKQIIFMYEGKDLKYLKPFNI